MFKKLKNYDVKNILMTLEKTGFKSKQLPVPFLWNFKINMNKLVEIGNTYDQARNEIVEKYSNDERSEINEDASGEKNPSPIRRIKDEFQEDWIRENQELLDQETDFEFVTVSVDLISDLQMTPEEFEAISQFMFEI